MQSGSDDSDASGAASDHPPAGAAPENAGPQAEHRERICYSRDQLLVLQEAGKISEDILKIKQDFEVEIKAAGELIKELPERMAGLAECKFYSAGSCKFGNSCKFSHHGHYQGKTEIGKIQLNFSGLPSRPGERECPYYMRTGGCKFSTNCRFHHPDPILAEHDPFSGFISCGSPEQLASGATLGMMAFPQSLHLTSDWDVYQANGELIKALPERGTGLADCKFYLAGCCKFGTTCKFSHHGHYQEKTESENAQLNFSDLPSPLGEKECPYCLGTGGFMFSTNCRFHHMDPHITGLDHFSGFANGRLPKQLASGASLATSFSQNLHLTSAWDFYQKQAVKPKQPFYCDICKVECNSQAMLASHLNGKKHKARLEEPSMAQDDEPDECEHYGKLANDKLVTVEQPTKDYNSVNDDKPSKEDCLVTTKDIGYESEPVMATKHATRFVKKVKEPTTERRENVKEPLDEYPQRPGEPDCSYFIKYGTCKYRYVCKFHHPSSSTSRGLAAKADDHVCHQERMEEYPDKPGKPECSYFLKFGSCMFRAECKYHHPIDRLPRVAPCIFSPNGLPLRPDQPICSYYSRFGICKFGPRCRFDHPMEYGSSVPAEDLRSSQGSSADESGWCTG